MAFITTRGDVKLSEVLVFLATWWLTFRARSAAVAQMAEAVAPASIKMVSLCVADTKDRRIDLSAMSEP